MNGRDPKAIGRSDGSFVVLNVDLSSMTQVQRLGLAGLVWDQVRVLMEQQGRYKPPVHNPNANLPGIGKTADIDLVVAQAVGESSWTTLKRLRPRLVGNDEIIQKALNNEFENAAELERALGFKVRMVLEGTRASRGKADSFYGHGDKFHQSIEPLARYLNAWKGKGFLFAHVNPKEAKRRLRKLDNIIADLQQVREELERRSHVATLRAPSEKRRENRS